MSPSSPISLRAGTPGIKRMAFPTAYASPDCVLWYRLSMQTMLRIPLSEETLQVLDEQATRANLPVEEFIAKKLPQITVSNSEKPIVLTDAERQRIEQLVGKNISTGEELIRVVEHALTVSLNGLSMTLTPYLLDRLKSRCIGMEFPAFMDRTIKRALEQFAGLR
jgi:hypothetical protein